MRKSLQEITPLTGKDCFYIVERYKYEFVYPLHHHAEFELNFIEHAKGVKRIVGDSVEEIGEYDLTLVAGDNLDHMWEQGSVKLGKVREITIQFPRNLLEESLLERSQFDSIRNLLERASRGVAFSQEGIMRVYNYIDRLASMPDSFEKFLDFLKLLYELSIDRKARTLASSSYADVDDIGLENRRINKVKDYVIHHYAEDLRLEDLATLAGMSPTSFSRFFKQHTGRGVNDYLVDIRLGNASRLLTDTDTSISEICYQCGFNNLSNFNRTFKSRRGYTPRDFRTLFKKNRQLV